MTSIPLLLVPGLLCTSRLYDPQLPYLWQSGPVTIANHTRHDSMAAIAADILASAPPRFALAGLSMGGYLAFEIVRQAPERVLKLALLDTSARPETPQQTERRLPQIEMAKSGRLQEILGRLFPLLVHPDRHNDAGLRAVADVMVAETGPDAFIRQQTAIMQRPDMRPNLGSIRCPTLVLVGDTDALTPPEHAREIAAGITGSTLVIVPGCGHLSTLEKPDIVTQHMTAWLQAA
jgi:pimeloyl-ACP methyl ester carboxylesterase